MKSPEKRGISCKSPVFQISAPTLGPAMFAGERVKMDSASPIFSSVNIEREDKSLSWGPAPIAAGGGYISRPTLGPAVFAGKHVKMKRESAILHRFRSQVVLLNRIYGQCWSQFLLTKILVKNQHQV